MHVIFLIPYLLFWYGNQINLDYSQNQFADGSVLKQEQSNKLDLSIILTIKYYYHRIYGDNLRKEEIINKSNIEITYYSIPQTEDEYSHWMFNFYIPFEKEPKGTNILEGDINNDGIDDLVIKIYTSGGGQGGNVEWWDYFAFINQNGNYILADVAPQGKLSGCTGGFWAESIENNYILGNSNCYAEGDARCCPSLHYETRVIFENDKLRFFSNTN